MTNSIAGLVGLALASAILYWQGITHRYPLAEGLLRLRLTWASFDVSSRAGWAHAGIYGLLVLCYMLALRLAVRIPPRHVRTAIIVIASGWLLFSTSLLGAYPGESLDIFDYLVRGWMQANYGVSPLETTPSAFPNQPFYDYHTWHNWVDAYGPLWEYPSGMVARAVGALSPGRLENYIAGYRLLAIMMAGVCGVLIYLIVGRSSPEHTAGALVAWLWNPLLLMSTAVGAHNDGIMLAFILVALLLVQRERWLLGILALGLAAHVKVTALLLLPVMGLWLVRRRGWRHALAISAVALAFLAPLSWALYAPLGGWQTLPRMLRERAILTTNSPANIVYDLLRERWNWPPTPARHAAIRGATLLFLVLAAGPLLRQWQQTRLTTENGAFWRGGIAMIMTYLIVGCFWFQAWYVMWVLALAALLPAGRFTLLLMPLFSLGALWSNISTDFLSHTGPHRLRPIEIDSIMVATLLTPMVCVLLVPALWRIFRRPHTLEPAPANESTFSM
ncbi:MAG TPA: glycosyltransferase 87 family protein [Herpetosiphonaceae bacterium]|nr:glycosyltransferase 87 family protein [Herpetosiphonaceae bacterium]